MDENEIVKKVKSYEDACKVLEEIDKPEEKMLARMKEIQEESNRNVQLYIQLTTITRALNQNWTPQFFHKKCRYFIMVHFFSEIEKSFMKNTYYEVAVPSRIADIKYATLYVSKDSGAMSTDCGYQFAYKSEALANGSINNFGELWVEYFTGCPAKEMQV
jgi:hypothetical protein